MLLLLMGSAFAPYPRRAHCGHASFCFCLQFRPTCGNRFDRHRAFVPAQRAAAFTSATSSAAMLTMRRTVADSVSTCTG